MYGIRRAIAVLALLLVGGTLSVALDAESASSAQPVSSLSTQIGTPAQDASLASTALACAPDWQNVPAPRTRDRNGLSAISVISANDIWAVGGYANDVPGPQETFLAMHWDGQSWTIVPTGISGSIFDVVAIAPNDVWAVGDYSTGSDTATLTVHWDGSSWTQVPSPTRPGFSTLRGGDSYRFKRRLGRRL